MNCQPEAVLLSRREIREATGWSDWQVRSYCRQLVEMEYLYGPSMATARLEMARRGPHPPKKQSTGKNKDHPKATERLGAPNKQPPGYRFDRRPKPKPKPSS